MKILFRGIALLLAVLLTVSILTGCGGDDDTDEPIPVSFVSANPPGSEIGPLEFITITFDNTPTDVTVSAGTVAVAGKTATITGPFTPVRFH